MILLAVLKSFKALKISALREAALFHNSTASKLAYEKILPVFVSYGEIDNGSDQA